MDISLRKNQAEYQMVNVQLQRRNNNLKLNDLTLEELQDGGNSNNKDSSQSNSQVLLKHVWKGIGKAFLQVETSDYVKEIESENKEIKDEIKALEIKKNYVETTLNNTASGMDKLFGKKN